MAENYVRFLKRGNTGIVEVKVTSLKDGTSIDDAAIEVTLRDSVGDAVAGQIWPLNIPHDSNDLYFADLSSDLVAVVGDDYEATLTVNSPTAGVGLWLLPIQFEERAE